MVSKLFLIMTGIMLVNGSFHSDYYRRKRNPRGDYRATSEIIHCSVVCSQHGCCTFSFDNSNRCNFYKNLTFSGIQYNSWHSVECKVTPEHKRTRNISKGNRGSSRTTKLRKHGNEGSTTTSINEDDWRGQDTFQNYQRLRTNHGGPREAVDDEGDWHESDNVNDDGP